MSPFPFPLEYGKIHVFDENLVRKLNISHFK